MKKFFDRFHQNQIVRAVMYLLIGLLLFLKPSSLFNGVLYLISLYFLVNGILNLVQALKVRKEVGLGWMFSKGILYIFLFFFLLLFGRGIASILPILFGLAILINGVTQLTQGLNMRQFVNVTWQWSLLYGIAQIIVGGLILFNPFSSLLLLLRFTGVFFLVMGVSEAVQYVRYRNYYRG